MIPILMLIALIGLIIASYTDIRTREVPDWLNFSLIGIALGLRLLYAVVGKDINILLYGVYGFIAFLIVGLAMYYLGQWGGGDSKLLMGLGGLIGLEFKETFLINFLILIVISGAIYGIIFSVVLAIKNKKKFIKKFIELNEKYIKIKRTIILSGVILFIISFFFDILIRIPIYFLILFVIFGFYLFVFARAIERTVMYKLVNPSKLTEGDWIVKDIKVKGKYVTGPKELGITKEQIMILKKAKIKKVLIKEGIPFVPSFLIAYLLTFLVLDYGFSFLVLFRF